MIGLVGITALLVCASLVVGRAAAVAIGLRDTAAAAPALGLALLLIASNAVTALGGAGAAAAALDVVLVVASACYLLLRRATLRTSRARCIGGVVAAVATFAVAALPFLSQRGVGTLGVSVLDDIAVHQYWAWALEHGDVYPGLIGGYPVGPHSLVAALATATSSNVAIVFGALLLGVPVLSALTVYSLLRHLGTVLAVVASILVPLTYLAASLFGEGAFKEPTMALLMLGFAALFREVRAIRGAIAFGIVAAGCLLVEGRTGAAWPGMCVVIFLAFTAFERRLRARQAVFALVAGVATTLVAVLPELGSLTGSFAPSRSGSNVPNQVPVAEVFGIWGNADFRIRHTSILVAPSLAVIGAVLFVGGLAWFVVRRRDPALPVVALAGLAVYGLVVLDTGNPYLRVKALMIAAVPVAAVIFGALFDFSAERAVRKRSRPLGVVRPLFAIGFAATAFWCTLLVLRAAPVQANSLDAELASIRAEVKGQPTLFLVADAFGLWKLRGASATPFTPYAVVPRVPVRFLTRETPASQAPADGFAAVAGSGLDRFRYAVTTNAAYNVAPPANWSLVKATPHYFLWRRSGTSASCGASGTRPASVASPSSAWEVVKGKPTHVQFASSDVATGTTVQQTLALPPGRWELDLQYQTPTPVTVEANGEQFTLPEDLNVFGPFWKAGTIRSKGGPTRILVTEHRRPFPSEQRTGLLGALVAVRMAPASCKAN